MLANRYLIKEKLGQGGNGITYSAIDTKIDRAVAIKVLSLLGLDDWKKVELFEREAKILNQLNHPAIPQYIDYFQIETKDNIDFCIVRELATGQSLATLIDNGWQPDETTIRNIAEKVLDILIYLQQLTPPVIHRDIKPQNIIYQPDTKKLFLVDFGAVQNTYHHTVMGSTVVGTYGYMSPEQYRGNAVLSTDLYGLGCTLLFLLTGQSPAELPQRKLKINFRSLVNIKSNFANWIEKLIEPDPEERFQNAREAFDILREKIELRTYKTKYSSKPKYTSIYVRQDQGETFIFIPPVLFWNNYSRACWGWIFYCIFIFINIATICISNPWLGYIYGILIILEFATNRIVNHFLYFIDLIFLTILIILALINGDLIQLIPLTIICINTLLFHELKIKLIKDLLFTTKITIINRLNSKYLKIERIMNNKCNSDPDKIWFNKIRESMRLSKKLSFASCTYSYNFGFLLSFEEKEWLIKKILS